jgi:hypothetical protein
MKGLQRDAFYSIKLHQRLIKPPYPVMISCPACGHKFMEVNSDIIEISNDFGLPWNEIRAFYHWQRIKHSCGSFINVLWIPVK